jgi:hypothetical protein
MIDPHVAIATIKTSFGIELEKLTEYLDTSLQNINSWLNDEVFPSKTNINQLTRLVDCAKIWNSIDSLPLSNYVKKEDMVNFLKICTFLNEERQREFFEEAKNKTFYN